VFAVDFILAVEAVRRFGPGLEARVGDPVVTPSTPTVFTVPDQLQGLNDLPQA